MTLAKTPPSFDLSQTVTVAKAALDIEANALRQAADRLDGGFTAVVARILACTGRVVVMGMGKSGHVGNKIAATLASTGTPAFFVHPGEASHGDLGMITADDLVLAVSNSGESDELNAVLPVIKRMGIGLIALTGGADSSLARYADGVLNSAVDKEACPSTWRQLRALRCKWHWVMRWRSPCWRHADSNQQTLRARTQEAHWAASYSPTYMTSCVQRGRYPR